MSLVKWLWRGYGGDSYDNNDNNDNVFFFFHYFTAVFAFLFVERHCVKKILVHE
jgi:hypothetical protein